MYSFCRSTSALQIVFNLLFGMSIFTSGFCLMTVTERASKAKHIQFVSGVYTFNFWLSALLWDLIIHFVACALLLVSVSWNVLRATSHTLWTSSAGLTFTKI